MYSLKVGSKETRLYQRDTLDEIYQLVSQMPGELCRIYEHTLTGFILCDAFPTGWHQLKYYQEKIVAYCGRKRNA